MHQHFEASVSFPLAFPGAYQYNYGTTAGIAMRCHIQSSSVHVLHRFHCLASCCAFGLVSRVVLQHTGDGVVLLWDQRAD